ncbi:MAG: DUF2232 domain-containing protein [Mariprofundaceae bacterium]
MMGDTKRVMPPYAEFILTHRLPCALLAVGLFASMLWLPVLGSAVGLAAPLLLLGSVLNLLVPVLFSIILLGGGVRYALHVGLLFAVIVTLLAAGWLELSMLILLFSAVFGVYVALPIWGSWRLRTGSNGLEKSALWLAMAFMIAVFITLFIEAQDRGLEMQAYVAELLRPWFDVLSTQLTVQMPSEQQQNVRLMLEEVQETTVKLFPGTVAFCLWLTWWSNVIFSRNIAMRYGFYDGDKKPLLALRFSLKVAALFVVASILAFLGVAEFVMANIALLVAGMLAVHGIAVAHTCLRVRHQQGLIVLMYVMILIWSAMIVPFVLIALLDIRFDYRRMLMPMDGGK